MKFSLIMSVYKEPIEYIKLSVDSVINQTLAPDEIIIVIDNPNISPSVFSYIQSVAKNIDIKVVKNASNIGLAQSLNKALSIVHNSSQYIARMDADDICHPQRFYKQYNFMQENSNVSLVGCNVNVIDEFNNRVGRMRSPINESNSHASFLIKYKSLCFHPTWFVRKSIFNDIGNYSDLLVSQDYDFLYRLVSNDYLIENLDDYLLDYRVCHKNFTAEKFFKQFRVSQFIRNKYKKNNNNKSHELSFKKNFLLYFLHNFGFKFYLIQSEKKSMTRYFYILLSCISPYIFFNWFNVFLYKVLK